MNDWVVRLRICSLWVSDEPSGRGIPGDRSQMTEVLEVASLHMGNGEG